MILGLFLFEMMFKQTKIVVKVYLTMGVGQYSVDRPKCRALLYVFVYLFIYLCFYVECDVCIKFNWYERDNKTRKITVPSLLHYHASLHTLPAFVSTALPCFLTYAASFCLKVGQWGGIRGITYWKSEHGSSSLPPGIILLI